MAPRRNQTLSKAERQATTHELLQEKMRLAIRHTLITVLEEEVDKFIQAALYQQTPSRKNYRNGHYERDLVTTMGEIEDLPVPRTQGGFHTELFEHYQRHQAELDESICEMLVKGVLYEAVREDTFQFTVEDQNRIRGYMAQSDVQVDLKDKVQYIVPLHGTRGQLGVFILGHKIGNGWSAPPTGRFWIR